MPHGETLCMPDETARENESSGRQNNDAVMTKGDDQRGHETCSKEESCVGEAFVGDDR